MYSEDGWLGNRIVLVGVGSLFDWRLSMMMANVLQALHVFVIFAVLLDSSSWMNPWDEGSTISGTQSTRATMCRYIWRVGGYLRGRGGDTERVVGYKERQDND